MSCPGNPPPDLPCTVPPDVAARVHGFAEMLAAHQPAAASAAMIAWVADADGGYHPHRTRLFATAATVLAAGKVRDLDPVGAWWKVRVNTAQRHDVAMCQVVVRIANGEPEFADDLLAAHRTVHGLGGLFWLGVFAVRLLADLLPEGSTP